MKALLTLMSLILATSSASATKIVGNGGDVAALEFVAVANEVYEYLVRRDVQDIKLPELRRSILQAKVESTDKKLSLDGVPKDAINYPSENRIIFNRIRWNEMSEAQKPALVLHEYLGLIQVNDASYKYSHQVLAAFGYGKKIIEVNGPFTVNFATDKQFRMKAHVTLENYGPQDWIYDSSNEKMRLVVAYKGERKVFALPASGRIVSASSATDGEDDGLNIYILQPVLNKNGKPKEITENGSTYVPHVVRQYRVEFSSSKKYSIPEEIEFVGPIANFAG